MKHTNLKIIGCLFCIVVLLVLLCIAALLVWYWVAIPKSIYSGETRSFESGFVVADGVLYLASHTHKHQNGKFIYALTLVSPRDQHYYPAVRYVNGELQEQGEIYFRYATNKNHVREYVYYDDTHPEAGDTKIADVPFHFVYFVDNGKVVFQMSHEKLGIDVSDTWHAFDSDKLWPILEKMIREHVPLKETEREE